MEGDEVGGRAAWDRPSDHAPRARLERATDVARTPAAVIDLRRAALGRACLYVDEGLPREGLCRFRTQLVATDDGAGGGGAGVEALDRPRFAATSGSTRSPHQFSCWRQRSPSLRKTSSSRRRFLVMPWGSAS